MSTSVQQPVIPTAPQIQLLLMPQLAEARDVNDDWTGTNDAAARRRAQTRLNTRAYRKRKVLAKKAGAAGAMRDSGTTSERLVECWDIEQQSFSVVSTSRIKQVYDARSPLLPSKSARELSSIIFPLCPDHLITLLQYNALRALAANRTLISGILVTPLGCGEEEITHIVPYPLNADLIPVSLLPTILQQTVPHSDWIDMFPSPEARDRLICAEGTFDEDDLWMDCVGGLFEGFPDDEVTRRGLIAWSPPWDITGWEMSEGFLRKWGWVLKGLPEALEATNRWRLQRGEEPFVHEDLTSCTTI